MGPMASLLKKVGIAVAIIAGIVGVYTLFQKIFKDK